MMDTQYAQQYMQGQPVYAGSAPAPFIKQPSGWGKLWAAFGLAFLVLFIQGIAMVFGMLSRSDDAMMTVGEIAGGITALLFVLALGGKLLATPSMQGMREAWRIIRWIFIADAVIAIIDLITVIADGSFVLAELWPLRIIVLILMCAGIGLFEEATFRGLIFHGLLARMGTNQKGVFWAVIVSSFVFGLMHIDPTSMSWTDPSQIFQAILKVAQTGIFGFAAAAVVLKTGNLWPVALLHGLNDFMLMFITNGLMSSPVVTEYVTEGTDGLIAIGIYVVLCAAYLPSAIAALRVLKEHPAPDRGQFYRARTYPQYYIPAPQVAYETPVYAATPPATAYAPAAATYPQAVPQPVPAPAPAPLQEQAPATMYSPGQYPPTQYPPAQYPPTQYSPAQYPPTQNPPY